MTVPRSILPSASDSQPPTLQDAVLPAAGAALVDPDVKRSESVLRIFLQDVPGQLASIGQAIAAGDAQGLKSSAHKLRGSCLAVGVPRMAELCGRLELASDQPAPLFAELQRAFALTQAELTRSQSQAQPE